MALFGNKTVIGLDIGSAMVKAVELEPHGGSYRLRAFGFAPLPPEAIVQGSFMNAPAISAAISEACSMGSFKSKDVVTSVSGHSVIVKRIALPAQSKEELEETIRWEAEQYIPFDIADVNLDYQILEGSSLSGEGNMDVLLAAAKKDKINDYAGVINQAGLQPIAVDIAAFALQNAFEANYEFEPHQVIALCDIGAAVSSITVLHGGTSVYWRDINVGGNQYTDAIQKELNLSADQAERMKRGEEIDGIPYERVLPILASVTEDVGIEIQKTLDFFKNISGADEGLDRLYLTGGSAQVVHLKEALGERLHTQVEILNPFRKIQPAGRDVGAEILNDMSPTASVAVGLALRKMGD